MQKGLIRKGLVLSIIILFISVGVQPVFAEESITSTLDNDEDCIECQESDRISLLKAKIFLFKVKVVTNVILSSRLGDIPEIKKDCQEILDVINSDKPLSDRPICDILWSICVSMSNTMQFLESLSVYISNEVILSLMLSIYDTLMLIGATSWGTGFLLDCWEWKS